MSGKGLPGKGKGMSGARERGTLLFQELLELSTKNYEQQMLAAVSIQLYFTFLPPHPSF